MTTDELPKTTDEPLDLVVGVCLEGGQLQRQVAKAARSLGHAILNVEVGAESLCLLPQRSILVTDESWFHEPLPDPLEPAREFRPRCVMLHIVQSGNLEGTLKSVRAGACNVLERPVDDSVLTDNIRAAADLETVFARRQRMCSQNSLVIDSLNVTEATIFNNLIEGRANKEIARELGIGLRSVEFARVQLMEKLNVTTLAQLVAIAASEPVRAKIEPLREFDAILSRHQR